jgi:hypothetical protein
MAEIIETPLPLQISIQDSPDWSAGRTTETHPVTLAISRAILLGSLVDLFDFFCSTPVLIHGCSTTHAALLATHVLFGRYCASQSPPGQTGSSSSTQPTRSISLLQASHLSPRSPLDHHYPGTTMSDLPATAAGRGDVERRQICGPPLPPRGALLSRLSAMPAIDPIEGSQRGTLDSGGEEDAEHCEEGAEMIYGFSGANKPAMAAEETQAQQCPQY